MQADGLQLVLASVGERLVLGIGQHDRRTVGSEQREQFQARAERGRLRKDARNVFRIDRLDIGERAVAKLSELLRRQVKRLFHCGSHLPSFPAVVTSPGAHQSRAMTWIFLTIRSGCGRMRSIDNSPCARSAPRTCMPSARRKPRWNWRAAMPW